jgi:hypothetical protein
VEAPEVGRQLIATPKLMITIFGVFREFTRLIIFLQELHSISRPSLIAFYMAATLSQLSV